MSDFLSRVESILSGVMNFNPKSRVENLLMRLMGSIGDTKDLETEDKSSLVAAINEIAESGGGGSKPYTSLKRLGSYIYEVTFDNIPAFADGDVPVLGACSSYVQDGKLYRNFDWSYSELASFHVICKGFEGIAISPDIEDGDLNSSAIGQLPYRLVDGCNDHGIRVSTHVLFNDWDWVGTGDTPLYKIPYTILSSVESLDNFETKMENILADLYATETLVEADYLLQFIVTDGTATYAILPPKSSSGSYVVYDISENPKLTNFRWVALETVIREGLQDRPTGVERWNLMPCDLKDLRFTKAYESTARLSEFIGIDGTTKDSTDEELTDIYNEARNIYLTRERDGQTWQTMHSVVYNANGMESLWVQEDWNKDYIYALKTDVGNTVVIPYANLGTTPYTFAEITALLNAKKDVKVKTNTGLLPCTAYSSDIIVFFAITSWDLGASVYSITYAHIRNDESKYTYSESEHLNTVMYSRIASAYSETADYNVGDYCTYFENVYRCTTAIVGGESWTSNHWVAITVMGEISNVKSDFVDEEQIIVPAYTNLVDTAGYTDGKLLNSNGAVNDSAGQFVTGFIPITSGDVVRFKPHDNIVENSSVIAFYDANKTITASIGKTFSSIIGQAAYGSPTITDNTFTIDTANIGYYFWSNIAYVRFCAVGGGAGAIVTVNEEISGTVTETKYTLKEEIKVKEASLDFPIADVLKGRNIVCFGDSILALIRNDTGVLAQAAKMTGGNFINCAFGGCRMSQHPESKYDAFSFYQLANAVASNDFSDQDVAAVATGVPDYYPEQLARLKAVNWNEIDEIVVAYGTNDYDANVVIDGSTNSTIIGALKNGLSAILTAYPHIKVNIASTIFRMWSNVGSDVHTNTNGDKLPDVNNALRDVAAERKANYIDLYNTCGITTDNASTMLSDGTHPSAVGCKIIGRVYGGSIIKPTNAKTALKSDIPQNVSAFTNDSGYLTLATLPIYGGEVV